MVDATEDCFDCFNRSKDNTGGAQALSLFQIVEKKVNTDEEEKKVRVAMLKSLKVEYYEPEPVKVEPELYFGEDN